MYAVRGYFKPESSFHTIAEWETICNEFLALQKNGFDVRGGTIDYSPQLIDLINKYFSYQWKSNSRPLFTHTCSEATY